MFGIELIELLVFFKNVGLAVAGAASFWGVVFIFFGRALKDAYEGALWHGVAQKLLWLFFPAVFFFGLMWLIIAVQACVFCVAGHEGISLAPETAYSELSFILQKQFSVFFLLELASLAVLFLFAFKRRFLFSHLRWVYGFFITLITIIYIYPWKEFGSISEAVSISLHSWHSILTLGSVITVDFIYIALRYNLRNILPKLFSFITVGIWVGLGLDFIGAGIVFGEEFVATPRTLFMQTLIGVIIINGVLLSGPIARAVLAFQKRMHAEVISLKLHRIIGISGVISLGAWSSITALDGFRSITFSYQELFLIYIVLVVFLYISREFVDKLAGRLKVWR